MAFPLLIAPRSVPLPDGGRWSGGNGGRDFANVRFNYPFGAREVYISEFFEAV